MRVEIQGHGHICKCINAFDELSYEEHPADALLRLAAPTQLVLSSSPNWCTASNLSPHSSQTQVSNTLCGAGLTIVYLQSGYNNSTVLFFRHLLVVTGSRTNAFITHTFSITHYQPKHRPASPQILHLSEETSVSFHSSTSHPATTTITSPPGQQPSPSVRPAPRTTSRELRKRVNSATRA